MPKLSSFHILIRFPTFELSRYYISKSTKRSTCKNYLSIRVLKLSEISEIMNRRHDGRFAGCCAFIKPPRLSKEFVFSTKTHSLWSQDWSTKIKASPRGKGRRSRIKDRRTLRGRQLRTGNVTWWARLETPAGSVWIAIKLYRRECFRDDRWSLHKMDRDLYSCAV